MFIVAAPVHEKSIEVRGVITTIEENRRYYRDTRGEEGYDGWSDITASVFDANRATKYQTVEEAEKWADEFLSGEYQILSLQLW